MTMNTIVFSLRARLLVVILAMFLWISACSFTNPGTPPESTEIGVPFTEQVVQNTTESPDSDIVIATESATFLPAVTNQDPTPEPTTVPAPVEVEDPSTPGRSDKVVWESNGVQLTERDVYSVLVDLDVSDLPQLLDDGLMKRAKKDEFKLTYQDIKVEVSFAPITSSGKEEYGGLFSIFAIDDIRLSVAYDSLFYHELTHFFQAVALINKFPSINHREFFLWTYEKDNPYRFLGEAMSSYMECTRNNTGNDYCGTWESMFSGQDTGTAYPSSLPGWNEWEHFIVQDYRDWHDNELGE